MPDKVPYECDCSCHKEGSSEIHFEPCCDGDCPRCGVPVTNSKKHQETCPEPLPKGRSRGRPRKKR